jgi:hypothetical protein
VGVVARHLLRVARLPVVEPDRQTRDDDGGPSRSGHNHRSASGGAPINRPLTAANICLSPSRIAGLPYNPGS